MDLAVVTYHHNFLSAVPYKILLDAGGTWLSILCNVKKASLHIVTYSYLKSYLYCRSRNVTALDLVISEIKCVNSQHSYFALYLENSQELQEVCQPNPLHSKSWGTASNRSANKTLCPRYLSFLESSGCF